MEGARVFLVEDDEGLHAEARQVLLDAGHVVVLAAKNWGEVESAILQISDKGINLGVIDGHISRSARDCSDGKAIARHLRERIDGIEIIAFTRSSEYEANYGTYVRKSGDGNWKTELPKVIASL